MRHITRTVTLSVRAQATVEGDAQIMHCLRGALNEAWRDADEHADAAGYIDGAVIERIYGVLQAGAHWRVRTQWKWRGIPVPHRLAVRLGL